jgi:plastocyanin
MRASHLFVLCGAGLLAGTVFAVAPPKTVAVRMHLEAFQPAKITVARDAHIVWTNTDTMPHSVTADDGRFDSGPILPGKSFEWTAKDVGAVPYHCIFHPSMTAEVNVKSETVNK